MVNLEQLARYCEGDMADIENFAEALIDTAETWNCHHRAEILPCGRFSITDLKKFGLYWHRPANELVLLRKADHIRLHKLGNKNRLGKKNKASANEKTRAAKLGALNPMYGRTGAAHPFFRKSHTAETKKKLSAAKKGRRWFNNGSKSVMAYDCPPGFRPGRLSP